MNAEEIIREAGSAGDGGLDIARVALAFAAFERARIGLDRYLHHLDLIAEEAGRRLAADPDAGVRAVSAVIAEEHGYRGDELTYDDPQNANLMRVIDRRKGLPVALGIIYMATARTIGCTVDGLNFPGHFLVRVEWNGKRSILDPFHGGVERQTPELRALLKVVSGAEAELEPSHFATVSDRGVLLRLQNNIKIRRIRTGDLRGALETVERMRWLAPEDLDLHREAGLICARTGRIQSAIETLESYVLRETREPLRQRVAVALQSLKSQLH